MTEAEWAGCTQPGRMMRHLRRAAGQGIELRSWFAHPAYGTLPRKWRCFLAACCRRVVPCLSGQAVRLIEFASDYVDSDPTEDHRQRVQHWFGNGRCSIQQVRLLWGLTSPLGSAVGELRNIAGRRAWTATAAKRERTAAQRVALDAEAAAQCDLIRDIMGNPFRPPTFEAVWRSSAVAELATAMYDSRDFTRLPELGTAIAQAGCSDAAVLAHCGEPGSHAQGCWVVDKVLGRS